MFFEKITNESPDFAGRTGIQFVTEFNELIPFPTLDANDQLTVLTLFFLQLFICCHCPKCSMAHDFYISNAYLMYIQFILQFYDKIHKRPRSKSENGERDYS